ncbi:MAG: hypothetical protein HW403_1269 [Dehalococcoidia bacterium]|nr:hypothetical protein [Dehalococcoidia bacterium]
MLAVSACIPQDFPKLPCPYPKPSVSQEVILKLGFDPSTIEQCHKGEEGTPKLPEGLTYKEVIPRGKYNDPDVIALDPTERYLYFVTHLQHPDGSAYRVDLKSGEVIQLTTGLHRPGGIVYYAPGKVLLVGEEGTGAGSLEGELGFWRAVKPDVPNQPTPPPIKAMGQYRGEGAEVVSPNTIYLGEDHPDGGPIFKYVLDSPPDLSKGTLYVFKENEGWIKTEYFEARDTGKEGTKFSGAEDMHIGPDGKLYMVVSARVESKVVTIDLETAKVTSFVTPKVARGLRSPDQLAFSPTGVLFFTGAGDVWAALPDGPDEDALSDGVYRFLTGMDVVQGIQFTKDGKTFYAAARGEADTIVAITGFKWGKR